MVKGSIGMLKRYISVWVILICCDVFICLKVVMLEGCKVRMFWLMTIAKGSFAILAKAIFYYSPSRQLKPAAMKQPFNFTTFQPYNKSLHITTIALSLLNHNANSTLAA